MLHNLMEDVVLNLIDEVLEKNPEVCRCDICRLDIAASALNHLPARYVVSAKGEVYSKVNILFQQFRVDVISAIVQAMMVVSKNPRHPKDSATQNADG